MAENNKSLEQELAEYKAKYDALQADYDATSQENKNLREIVKDDSAGKVVKGTVDIDLKSTDGKKQTVKAGFKSGYLRTLVIDGDANLNEIVESEALIAHANGKLTDEQKANNPLLGTISSEYAKEYITNLVKIKYAGIELK